MGKSIGMIEYKTVSSGIQATDLMVKTADVDVIEAETVCPGKYIAIISGELSAVKAAVDNAKETLPLQYIDSFVLGNPHESIFPAITGTSETDEIVSLGVLETFNASKIIVAADVAAKTADVKLIEIRVARGMCGKSYMLITGEVAAVTAAIERAKEAVSEDGMFLDSSIIARPDKKLCDNIL